MDEPGDLLVIVPSRGRPARLKMMLDAAVRLSTAATVIAVAVDDDDPDLDGYADLQDAGGYGSRVAWHQGPPAPMGEWTNRLAALYAGSYRALGSFGDDHVPVTAGWDRLLLQAAGPCGMAYPDDKRRADIPEAVIITSDVIRALGWMVLPGLRHFYCDDVWAVLGRRAGLLRYAPHVVVEHMHYSRSPGVARDATYETAERDGAADLEVFTQWMTERMPGDVALLRREFCPDVQWALSRLLT